MPDGNLQMKEATPPAGALPSPGTGEPLSQLELEMIELFVHFAQLFSLPKSLGEIFGLLFASEEALPFDEIVNKLRISKGSASQGLKFLRSINAVTTVYIPGERRDHFVAEDRLRPLITGFLKERFQPHLRSGEERVQRLTRLVEGEPGVAGPAVQKRIKRLRGWNLQAEKIMPILIRILAPK